MCSTHSLVKYVNPLQGTNSERSFSRGNTLPLVARPFGMTHWTPQTDEGKWAFSSHTRILQGIRATHQPSPWMGDYSHFMIMPTNGKLNTEAYAWSSFYRIEKSTFKPHYFKADLLRYRIGLELTATERCSMIRANFPPEEESRFLIKPMSEDSEMTIYPAKGSVTGCIKEFLKPDTNTRIYFTIVADQPVVSYGLFDNDGRYDGETSHSGKRTGAYIGFDATQGVQVTLRIGTSFISVEQAKINLEREIGNRSFEEVRDETEAIWEKELGRIEVDGGTEQDIATFYTCLYRASLFPRVFHEFDSNNKMVHFSPYDGQVHDGESYTDNGFWDTYRTVYSLLALISPKRLGEMMRGWTNGAKEGGWFPRWASPGYRNCMIGTHMDVIISDAYLRGIHDFDIETAYKIARRDAFDEGVPGSGRGREALQAYIDLGYVPAGEASACASRTQDYAYNDFGLAQTAKALGLEDDAKLFYKRSMNYKNVFDSSIGFMRGRNRDGSWLEPFDEFAWGHAYVEGGVWQSTWNVQHDPAGLIELMGGKEAFAAKLDKMLALPPTYKPGGYRGEIHEMSEMAAVDFGQYAHSNQPVHHVLYLFAAAGQPWKTQYWVRRVMAELYSPDSLSGDEDNGEMCSWYVLNALGIFPLCPGEPSFTLGSPLFRKTIVHLDNGSDLVIEAPNNSDKNIYVQSVELNGANYTKTWLSHEDLANGGTLKFTMVSEPAMRDYTDDELPFSLSTADGLR